MTYHPKRLGQASKMKPGRGQGSPKFPNSCLKQMKGSNGGKNKQIESPTWIVAGCRGDGLIALVLHWQ